MIEEFTRTAITTLLVQGTGWVVAVLIGIWAYILDKRVTEARIALLTQTETANKAVQDQYEKRLAGFRELLDAMANSTVAINALKTGQQPITEAINQMVVGLAKLLAEFQSTQVRWDDRGGNMLKQLEDLRLRMETLQREVRAA